MTTATSSGAPGPRPGAAAAAAQVVKGGGPPPAATQPPLPGGGVPRPRRLQYTGVTPPPPPPGGLSGGGGGGWMARVVVDPERGTCRTIGPFPDPHAAALAHDRVAIAYLGDAARPNFAAAFHPVERWFLRLCRERDGHVDVCALVADPGTYEARYAAFLRSVLRRERWGEYGGLVVEFFVGRAAEIGDDVLMDKDGGGERLEARFVEMHRNKAVDPAWRAWFCRRVSQLQLKSSTPGRRRRRRANPAAALTAVPARPQQ